MCRRWFTRITLGVSMQGLRRFRSTRDDGKLLEIPLWICSMQLPTSARGLGMISSGTIPVSSLETTLDEHRDEQDCLHKECLSGLPRFGRVGAAQALVRWADYMSVSVKRSGGRRGEQWTGWEKQDQRYKQRRQLIMREKGGYGEKRMQRKPLHGFIKSLWRRADSLQAIPVPCRV